MGTRLHVYEITEGTILSYHSYQIDEPVKKENVEKPIKELLEQADHIEDLHIGFYGTAGLRGEQCREKLLTQIKKALDTTKLVEAKILSGIEEAEGLMRSLQLLYPEIVEYTAIDMGGRSTQVVERNNNKVVLKTMETGIVSKNYAPVGIEGKNLLLLSAFQGVLNNTSDDSAEKLNIT